MQGMRECFFTQRVTISIYSGTCPTADPMPRSAMPCGQPKFSSTPSASVSSIRCRMSFHDSSSQGTIRLITKARSRHLRLTALISSRLICKGLSVISSMLFNPNNRRSAPQIAP